jgi:lysophospholipase L1-like esterase
VVGLGDSVTAGSACECTPFIEVYTTMLGEHASRPVQAVNLGRGGLTTDTLATQLGSSATRARLARASQVVVTIGANDLIVLIGRWQSGDCDSSCVGHATAAMGHRLRATLATVHRETPPTARVLVTTYWNVFEDGDVADRDYGKGFAAWSDGVTRSANAQICAAARAAAQSCVDLYAPFEGDGSGNPTALLADDGDHPNAAGHRLIARTLLDAGGSSG